VSAADNPAVTPAGENGLSYASGPGRWVMLVTVLGSAMASIDATVVGIALPAIGRDFGASLTALQWVVTAYTLALAGLLLFAGTLGDRYGRKRIFLTGVTWFALSSLLCGFAAGSALVIAGVLLLAAFVAWERRARMPMLPLSLFGSGQFTAANVVTFAVYGALGGALFLLPIELQQVLGYTALQAGISLLPVTAIMLALSARSGALAARIGPRLQMSVGPVVTGLGLALFTRIGYSGNYLTEVLPAVAVFGLGLAITVAPLTSTVLAAVPASHAGMASAVNNDVARAASLIAVAVLPAAAGLSGTAYLHPAEFSAGFGTASLISAGLCLAGGALAAVTIRNPRPQAGPAPQQLLRCALDAPASPAVPHR
jgi:MFS family permease